jgi:DNA-binding CsgD family transcriptional regulator
MQSDGRAAGAPSKSTVAEIELALDSARLGEAEHMLRDLDDPHSPHALVFAARLRLLYDDPHAAIRLLADRDFSDRALTLQRLLLLGSACARTGEYAAADEYFDAAYKRSERSRDVDALAALALARGRRYAFAREFEKARAQQRLALQAPSHVRKIEALELESFIYELEGRYDRQAATLERMLAQIDPSDERLIWQTANGTSTLAVLACEMDLPGAIDAVEQNLREDPWPPHLNLQRFTALKALGWKCALSGDYFNAFRYLRKSMAHAPSPAWQAMAALDRAYLARCLNEERWSRQELGEAEELAETVDWNAARDEERVALLLLAELFAAVDTARAEQFMAAFQQIEPGEGDDRLRAQADYFAGVAQLGMGNAKLAVKLLRESFAVYDRIAYDWRAGRCALRLFEATGDAGFLHAAGEKLRRYPRSWLADEVRRHATTKSGLPALPRMQQRVFEELCRGLPTAEIARNLGRSEYTIKNHIKLIFKAFAVKSRAALIAMVSRPRD